MTHETGPVPCPREPFVPRSPVSSSCRSRCLAACVDDTTAADSSCACNIRTGLEADSWDCGQTICHAGRLLGCDENRAKDKLRVDVGACEDGCGPSSVAGRYRARRDRRCCCRRDGSGRWLGTDDLHAHLVPRARRLPRRPRGRLGLSRDGRRVQVEVEGLLPCRRRTKDVRGRARDDRSPLRVHGRFGGPRGGLRSERLHDGGSEAERVPGPRRSLATEKSARGHFTTGLRASNGARIRSWE